MRENLSQECMVLPMARKKAKNLFGECQANLLKQHPDQTYEVMREFVEDNNFKWDWLVAGCTNEETGEKFMVYPTYPKGKPPELEGLEFEIKDILI